MRRIVTSEHLDAVLEGREKEQTYGDVQLMLNM